MHEAVELQEPQIGNGGKRLQNLISRSKRRAIDIWHFVVQASLEALNLSPDDIVEEYKRKMKSTEKDKETVIEVTLSFFNNIIINFINHIL